METNDQKGYTKILFAAVAATWTVILLAGAGWVGSIQSQSSGYGLIAAQLRVDLAKMETRLDFLARDQADLRIKVNELERILASGGRGGR